MISKKRITAVLLLLSIIATGGWGCALKADKPANTPHAADGAYSECRTCHENGSQGAPVTDHAKKADCVSCHRVATQGGH